MRYRLAVANRSWHTCALKNDGRRYCWGFNGDGQLGVGDTTNRTVPTAL